MELGMNYSLKIKTSSSVGNYEIIKMFIYALENKGFFKHLHEQHEGKRNQSMKIPLQSLFGS